MGCGGISTQNDKISEIDKINIIIEDFNKKYNGLDDDNTEIDNEIKEITLHNIGQEGFENFCSLKLDKIQILYLSENEISEIDCLEKFNAPNLENLDLSNNKIKKIDVFRKVNYNKLKLLDLRNNIINDISIFKEDSILPELKFLLLTNNEINFEDEEIKKILSTINTRMEKNNSNSMLENINDPNYSNILKKN